MAAAAATVIYLSLATHAQRSVCELSAMECTYTYSYQASYAHQFTRSVNVSARQLRLVLFLQYFPIQLLVAPNELRRICLARIFATCGHSQQSDRFRWTLHNRIQSECGIYERDANAGGGLDLMADRYSLQKKETKFERIISSAMSMCCCRCGRCRHRLRTLNHLWQFEMRLQHLTHWQLIHLLTSTWEFR